MGIYTKKGDRGTTGNLQGKRILKSDIVINLQGGVDECNAHIGHLRALLRENHSNLIIDSCLKHCQYTLFRIGAFITMGFEKSQVVLDDIKRLEDSMDDMTSKTGELSNFIYYNGDVSATYSQVIRSVIRRVERDFVEVLESRQWEGDYPLDYQYMNRLSDYFFTLSRYINYLQGDGDEIMKLQK